MTLFLELAGVAVLILLNAFFVAAEYGLVTARRTRIIELHHQGNRRARDVLRITGDPPRFIAAMQLGVTLTSLGIGALGEHALSQAFNPWMATALAIALAYLILTFFHVVVGELVPKGVALSHSEGTALWASAPVRAFFTIARPVIWVLQMSTELVLRLLGQVPPGIRRDGHSEAELRMLLTRSTEQGEIEQEERQMIDKVFDFADTDAAEVMVARPDVVALSVDLPPEEALATVLDSPYTRYPVYRQTLDDIAGVLHVRDLFSAIHDRGLANVRLDELLRPAYVVPETKDLASLLTEFKRTKNHFAVVVDEYGAMVGVCTLEDLIEEIVGNIEDEHDLGEELAKIVSPRVLSVIGRAPIAELNEHFGLKLSEADEYATIGGLVVERLGHIPKPGEKLIEGDLTITVTRSDARAVRELMLTLAHPIRPELLKRR